MRFLWLSNSPWTPSGYGVQTKLNVPRINAAGHPTAVHAYHGHNGTPINWNGIQIYGNGYHPYGMDVMHAHARNFNADALISQMDIWPFEPDRMLRATPFIPWVAWMPVDTETLQKQVYENAKKAYMLFVYSQDGQRQLAAAGLESEWIPCSVDTNVYKPQDVTPAVIAQLGFPADIRDRFVVGMVAMNKGWPPRKCFYENIAAFAALQKKHGDCALYLHTSIGGGPEQIDLAEYISHIGLEIGKDVFFADQYGMLLGYPDEMMVALYNLMDVHLLVSRGEGFGIPLIEAQACGTPVITGDWTSMPEILFSGWKVDRKDADPFYTALGAWQFTPRVPAIAEKLEMAYQMRGNADYRKRARKGAMAYDADRVMERNWLPALAKLQAKIEADRDGAGKTSFVMNGEALP